MKKNCVRQMMLSLASGLLCSVHIMECYPLVPAYFAALYMAGGKVGWTLVATYVGMLIFIPLVSVLYALFREIVYLKLKQRRINPDDIIKK